MRSRLAQPLYVAGFFRIPGHARNWIVFVLALAMAAALHGETTIFNLAPQSADRALLALSKQARIEILFAYDDLRQVRSNAVTGTYEPAQALEILLRGTGFTARQTGESKWVVSPTGPPKGSIKGKVLAPDGSPARRVRVTLTPVGHTVSSNESGSFDLRDIPPGHYGVVLNAPGFRPTQLTNVDVSPSQTVVLEAQTLQPAEDPARLEPYVVQARATYSLDHSEAHFAQQNASGNLDLSRTETDVLPYMIFNRSQIARSGVVNLNEFLQRELIDSTADTLPPEQNGALNSYTVGSSNLKLRGFTSDETVILVNGRRLPEVLTSEQGVLPPDVNFIPLSLVQQVEVLPVSASALYSGNAVGGVINIVLRPDVDATASEVSATYTNALGRCDAPQSSLSLVHAESLLHGKLRFRLNATFAQTTPPTEAELGFRQRRYSAPADLDVPLYRATPAVRSVRPDLAFAPGANAGSYAAFPPAAGPEPILLPLPPLTRIGNSPVTSVAPGSDGTRGLAAFEGRSGVRNLALFDSPGSLSTSIDSLDYPYGREQQRTTYYGSIAYDILPWLQLAFDGTRSSTVVHRGLDVLQVDLLLARDSLLNPFGQDVSVSLNETAPSMGENYNEARLEFGSAVLGAAIKLPDDWRVMLDLQYSHNLVKYRGLAGASADRWQQLVDQGLYNPLRDTQQFGPPAQFYDQVLIYRGSRGRFVTLGNYETIDAALRVRNESLHLPTGPGIVNAGADFRRNQMAGFTDQQRFGDGTLAGEPLRWDPRSLDRYSFFGELQAPLLPATKLPRWLHAADADLAGRYVASRSSRESNFAPTLGLRFAFPLGFTFRGSVTTSTRFPTPSMSRLHVAPSSEPGTIKANQQPIYDPVRKESYTTSIEEDMDPDLDAESAVTQTAGLIYQHGQTHRFRAAIDFVDTRKSNELFPLDKDQVVANESLWPERVRRAAASGSTGGTGRIVSVLTGRANLWERHSQDFTASLDYRWNGCFGGTLEAYVRGLYFHRYTVRTLPSMPPIDELRAPDGLVNILKYRANFGATWSNKTYAVGWDGHYFHSRLLPRSEWLAQGHDSIRPFWQFDSFVQSDLAQWLPWKSTRYGLRGQLRINNVFATGFPKYVNDQYGAGVQPYGDWRGRMYSVSVTATF